MKRKLYKALASTIQARLNCIEAGNTEWRDEHEERLQEYQEMLPSGSGFDSGTTIDLDASTGEKIVLNTGFHHMDDSGMYCGWSYHKIVVTPSLVFDFDLQITGRNIRDIKEYLYDMFHTALSAEEPDKSAVAAS